jgi:hypothetical protein
MFHMPESRLVAFGIHLLASFSLFSCLALFTYFILMPGFLFFSEGGVTILSLIGGVDVVLGPLITLIIYKKTKPSIKFDLAVIATIQIAALLYGLHSLWSVRPIAVFYAAGEYHVAYEATFEELTYTNTSNIPELNQLKPPTVAIELPEGADSLKQAVFVSIISTGKSYLANSELYSDYKSHIPELKNFGLSPQEAVENLVIKKDSRHAKLDGETFRFYKFTSSLKSGHVLLNAKTGAYIDIVR